MTSEGTIYAVSAAATSVGALTIATADYASIGTLVGAVGVLVGIVIGGIVQILTLKAKIAADALIAAELAAAAAREHREALAVVSAKADTIEHLVDGTSSKQIAKIEMLQTRLETTLGLLADGKATAVALAASTAATQQIAAAVQPAEEVAAAPHLQAIEENTAATADNTKRTDDTVQDLKDKA